jgi:hypothetical protein
VGAGARTEPGNIWIVYIAVAVAEALGHQLLDDAVHRSIRRRSHEDVRLAVDLDAPPTPPDMHPWFRFYCGATSIFGVLGTSSGERNSSGLSFSSLYAPRLVLLEQALEVKIVLSEVQRVQQPAQRGRLARSWRTLDQREPIACSGGGGRDSNLLRLIEA